jgi:hypothetical protein
MYQMYNRFRKIVPPKIFFSAMQYTNILIISGLANFTVNNRAKKLSKRVVKHIKLVARMQLTHYLCCVVREEADNIRLETEQTKRAEQRQTLLSFMAVRYCTTNKISKVAG